MALLVAMFPIVVSTGAFAAHVVPPRVEREVAARTEEAGIAVLVAPSTRSAVAPTSGTVMLGSGGASSMVTHLLDVPALLGTATGTFQAMATSSLSRTARVGPRLGPSESEGPSFHS